MATQAISYASAEALTITLTSLANGGVRQSTAVDNTSNLYIDALLGGSIQVGTTPTAGGTIGIYLYASWDGTNYTAGASGSDSAYTVDGEEGLLKLAEIIVVDATSDQDYVWGPISVASIYGGTMPSKWGIIVTNVTGVTTNATGTNNATKFIGVKYTV